MKRFLSLAALLIAVTVLISPASGRGPTVRAAAGDLSQALATDPVLVWNTFIGGGTDLDSARDMAVDTAGNICVLGFSYATWGTPLRPYSGGSPDVCVVKLTSSGSLVWHTFLGPSEAFESGIAADSAGNIYVSGSSTASWGSPLNPFAGVSDAFVAKLDANGTLLWNTFLGSSDGYDGAEGLALDKAGNIYLAGTSTRSWGSPLNPHAGNGGDVLIAKLTNGGTLLWHTFLGAANDDRGYALAVDSSGNSYVTGESSLTWGSPVRAFSGNTDSFVLKVNNAGALQWNTFLGGTGDDYGYGIGVDANQSVYVAGESSLSWGSPVRPSSTPPEAFAAKLNSSGALQWNSFLGGLSGDYGRALAVDVSENVYVAGKSQASWGSPFRPFTGATKPFVAKVNAGGALQWNGFLGGTLDYGYAITVDSNGSVYIAGESYGTWGSPLSPYTGGGDGFIAKLNQDPVWRPRHAGGDFDGDGVDEAAVDFGTAGIWLYNAGGWSQISTANPDSLLAADVDSDAAAELIADLGASGLWLWNAGAWSMLSGVNAETMAAGDVDADGAAEVVGDFGAAGLWLFNGGTWTQLSGVNADHVLVANVDGSGGAEIIGDFGATGLWMWRSGAWTQLSGVNADYVAAGVWTGGAYLVGDFGATGLWEYKSGAWTQLSGVNAAYVIAVDSNGDGEDELVGDFGVVGLWLNSGASWTQLSGLPAEYVIGADVDGSGDEEIVCDFGMVGLWLDDGGAWTQLSGVNAEYMMAGDFDGDYRDELLADFGSLGLWLWNDGAWAQASSLNAD